jgi:arylsulfatase A-like enzyme
MQAVIVSFDSLATNSLGCYGNEWIETPNCDRLAATGAVFDRCFVDTLGPLAGMAWATGHHSLLPTNSQRFCIGSLLRAGHVETQLIAAGEPQKWQQVFDFDDVIRVQGSAGIGTKPDEIPFAKAVKAAILARKESPVSKQPKLIWVHAPGPGIPPEGFDALYFEDFEERGQDFSDLNEEERSRHPAVYAGSVSLLDHWLGELLAQVTSDVVDESLLVIVMAATGFGWQKIKQSKLNKSVSKALTLGDQLTRIPLVISIKRDERFPNLDSLRSDRLVQTIDLAPSLLDWFSLRPFGVDSPFTGKSWLRELTEDTPARSMVWYGDGAQAKAIRSSDWLCIHANTIDTQVDLAKLSHTNQAALFFKPEDIWDINDIASQQPEVVTELLSQIPGNAQ